MVIKTIKIPQILQVILFEMVQFLYLIINPNLGLQTGASFHATTYREYLKKYVQGDFGKFYLGNDEPCNIIGKGDVQIKLPNGGIWKLNDVRHVPSLKRNLLLVGHIANSGYITICVDDF